MGGESGSPQGQPGWLDRSPSSGVGPDFLNEGEKLAVLGPTGLVPDDPALEHHAAGPFLN